MFTAIINLVCQLTGLTSVIKNGGLLLSNDKNAFTLSGLAGGPKLIPRPSWVNLSGDNASHAAIKDALNKDQVFIMYKRNAKPAFVTDDTKVYSYFKHAASIVPGQVVIDYLNKMAVSDSQAVDLSPVDSDLQNA